LQNESDKNLIEQLNIQGKKELETHFKQAVLKLTKAIK
jgi:tRNA(Met) cytidine acetyltransferase